MRWLLLGLLSLGAIGGLGAQPATVDSLARALATGLAVRGYRHPLPPVRLDSHLTAHARYAHDTIWLGPVRPSFPTPGDRMSLIYHEYCHARWQARGRFAVGLDSDGDIIQWDTEEWLSYPPSAQQIEREMVRYDSLYPGADPRLRAAFLASVSQPVRQPFRYAPSNLAREEIAAYQAQLAGAAAGLYPLSPVARQAIGIRLDQLAHTLRQRRAYERRHRLRPDGKPRRRRP